MEMKVSPALVLCVSVTVHLALPQHQLSVRPLPSDHLPVPDLQEDPNSAFEPGERDLLPHFLRRKLGSSFDPLYSSIGPPTRGNGSEVTQQGIGVMGPMPREFHELDFAELNVGPKTQRRVRRWLRSYTRCSVLWVWKDLGVRFWPRYLKEGRCTNERSCSLPEGMFCKPVESVGVSLLRWHCQGSRALESCAWIRARYPMNQTKISYKDQSNNTSPDPSPVKNSTNRTVSRPDWILYTVPASAFLIGIFLFSFICKTQRHRKTHVAQRTYRSKQVDNYTSVRHSTDSEQSKNIKNKDDAQSYENVEAAIYTNQEKVTYYVSADQDYITPDEENEQDGIGPRAYQDHLQLPQNLTDTDGESYENMANLYAQPRKCSQQHKHISAQEGDYLYPDQGELQDVAYTDTESYEMMADSHCSYKDFTHDDYIHPDDDGQKDFAFDHTDTDSYEQMNEFPFHKGMN